MDEDSLVDFLLGLIGREYQDNDVVDISTFEDEGLLTDDVGVVMRFADGEEFQVFVKQSKFAD